MNYKEKLIEIYQKAVKNKNYSNRISDSTKENISILANNCFSQKGVYTVFTTLCIYKIVHPSQDIRNHQTQISNGFSGRTIDTNFITPTLKESNLPSMAESGWLTRSLEQSNPYTLDYGGKINNKDVKKSFLELINDIQINEINPKYILVELFKQIIQIQKKNEIEIVPLVNSDKITISNLITLLEKQFSYNYKTFGGSKLPVLAFYSIYQILIKELARYKNTSLKALSSHTTSDKTSNSAGDIEIFKDDLLFEAVEIKLDKAIDKNIIRIAKEKIIIHNPKRYYVLSYFEILENDKEDINQIIENIKNIHGCQIVVNGLIPTLKYYFRLIENLEDFINIYSNLIQIDSELKAIHKSKYNEFLKEFL